MFQRHLRLPQRSFFLFGARQTGKSTLLRERLGENALYFDLLDPEVEDALARNPKELELRIAALPKRPDWVVLDEVQRVPRLLDIVHRGIEEKKLRFALTGSSARKLRRGQANLLAGRARVLRLHPLTHRELGEAFALDDALAFGTLPPIVALSRKDRSDLLRDYAHTYLREEIAAEQVLRRLDPFRNFLEIAAQSNGAPLNCANVGRDVGVDYKTVQSYYQVLEDTLLGFTLPPFHESLRRRQTAHAKFYFFDPGIKRALERLLDQPLTPRTYGYGAAFEHFLIAEIIRLADYAGKDWRFSHLRTHNGTEIDLIVDRPGEVRVFMEIKSSENVDERDTGTLERFAAESKRPLLPLLASRCPVAKRIGKVLCLPWQRVFEEMGL
jgi:predicted AAA+ superfamily ATPase